MGQTREVTCSAGYCKGWGFRARIVSYIGWFGNTRYEYVLEYRYSGGGSWNDFEYVTVASWGRPFKTSGFKTLELAEQAAHKELDIIETYRNKKPCVKYAEK